MKKKYGASDSPETWRWAGLPAGEGVLPSDYEQTIAALRAEIKRLTNMVVGAGAWCFADGHSHKSRLDEGICSLIFQRDDLKAENERLREGHEWISVENESPPLMELVLAYPNMPEYSEYQQRTLAYLNKNHVWINTHESRRANEPTHWMPLPPPPATHALNEREE